MSTFFLLDTFNDDFATDSFSTLEEALTAQSETVDNGFPAGQFRVVESV